MNADYPFMLPRIVERTKSTVTLKADSSGQTATVPIVRRDGKEYCFIEQASTFEKLYSLRPQRFRCWPFKDTQA